ncbi:MAG: aminoacyl-tRNA hydrolase [Verrucomicrobiae bacterium]|nr:aminoacyl-tRNA hydrolase [Verrucomicrobiae bacterium]
MPGRTKLVVGLGNPGREYAGTRHNIGFAVVERFVQQHGGVFRRRLRLAAEVAELPVGDGFVLVAKPLTYMNRSGASVAALLGWGKIEPPEMLVVVDDADLPLGRLRLRPSGGSGGHNGLRSVIESLGGCEDFPRLRVGIGRSKPLGEDITEHVLGQFGPAERALAENAVRLAAEVVECCLKEGLTTAMNRYNRKTALHNEREGEPV